MTYTVVVLDTETTGLDPLDGHRVIELCTSFFRTDDFEAWRYVGTSTKRFNPQRSIDIKAQQVHKITLTELANEPTFDKEVGKIEKVMATADMMVAHNVPFDLSFLHNEMKLVGKVWPPPELECYCTMTEGRAATAMGKVPNLQELCWALGVAYDATLAHAAKYDVNKTAECFFAGVKSGFFKPNFKKGES